MKKLATLLVTTAFTVSLLAGLPKFQQVHVQAGVSQAEIDQVWQKIREAEAEVNKAESEAKAAETAYEQASKIADEKAKQLNAQKKKITDLQAEVAKLKEQKDTDKLTAKQAELEKLAQQVQKLGQEDDEAALSLQQQGDKQTAAKQKLRAKRRAYEQVKRHAFSTETLKGVGDALTKQTSTEVTAKEIADKQTVLKNKLKAAMQKGDKPDLSDANKNNSYIDKTNNNIKDELEKLKNYVQPKPGVPGLSLTPAKKNVPQGQAKPKSETQQTELDLNSFTADELEEYIEEQTQELDDIVLRLNNKEGEDAEEKVQAELKQTKAKLEKKIAELKAQLAKIKPQAAPELGMPLLKLNPAKKLAPQIDKPHANTPDKPVAPKAPTLDEMQKKAETAERIAERAEAELKRAETEIKRLQAEKENNAKRKEKLEAENEQLVQELANKNKELESKKAKLKEAETKIEALKKTPEQVQSVIKEANELKSQINNLEEALEELVIKEKENKDEIGRTTNIYNNTEKLHEEQKAKLPQMQREAQQKREAAQVAKKAYDEAKAKQPSSKPLPSPKPQPVPQPQPQPNPNDKPNVKPTEKPTPKPNVKPDEANKKQENSSPKDNGNKKQLDKQTAKKPNTKAVPVLTTKAEEKADKVAEVKVLDAPKTAYQQGSNATISVRFQAEPKDLQTVMVDGKIVNPMHYNIKRGSTIIELKTSYLQKLGTGKHKLVATFLQYGEKKQGASNFEVTAVKRNVAKTGEVSQAGLAMLSFLLAGAAFLLKHR